MHGENQKEMVRNSGEMKSKNIIMKKNLFETSVAVVVASPWFPEAVKLLEENSGTDQAKKYSINQL